VDAIGSRVLWDSAGVGAIRVGKHAARAVIETACDISGLWAWIRIAIRPGAPRIATLRDTILVEEQCACAVVKATRADDVRSFGAVVLTRHFPADGAEVVDQVLDRRTAVVDELRLVRVWIGSRPDVALTVLVEDREPVELEEMIIDGSAIGHEVAKSGLGPARVRQLEG
jgi:hypothetical protein